MLVVTVVLTFLVCKLLPPRYTATASILIDSKPDPLTQMIYGGANGPGVMSTQVDVIQSDRVGLRVVRDLKLADNPQVRGQWQAETRGQGSIEAWLSDTLRRGVDVVPASVGSNILNLSYKGGDPRFAAALANAWAKAYIDTSLELRTDPAKQYSAFFDTRSKEARDRLEQAQAKLTAFQRQKGIIATDDRLDIETARLNELSSQLVGLQAVTSESGSRQTQASGESAERMQEVLNNGLISGLKADIARNEAKLQELNARLGVNHPQVVELKANLAELRSRMTAEINRVTGGVKVSNTINRQREAELRASLDAQRAQVLRLRAVRDESAVLLRDVDSAQRAYDAVLSRLTASSLESQSTQSSVYVLSDATVPIGPSSPKTGLAVLVAALGGLMLGVLAILAFELVDRRLRVSEDVTEALGLPIIGVMPRPVQSRLFGRRKDSKMQQRLMKQLPMTGKVA
jgi:chain length determinant protein EpsF